MDACPVDFKTTTPAQAKAALEQLLQQEKEQSPSGP
jgi:hypothetical protein